MIKLNGDQKKKLVLILGLALILPAVIYGTKLIQDRRSRAAGSNEVEMKVTPQSGTFYIGDAVPLQLTINSVVSRPINVSGAQAVLTIGDKFQINSVTCLPPFDGLPFVRINGLQVTVLCAISPTTPPVTLTSSDLPIAVIRLNVDPYATDGPTQIIFNSTRVTEAGIAGQAPDVSTAGMTSTYTITTVPPCPRGESGNLNCSLDGCIDTADFELFRQAFGLTLAEISVPQGQHTPDLYVDSTNTVDTADYEILRSNFGSCQ